MKLSKKVKAVLITLGLIIPAGILFSVTPSEDFKMVKNLDIMFSAFRELKLFYVDTINPEKLVSTGLSSMLETLDPYTEYIPEEEAEDFDFMTTGNYGGMGALVRKSGDYVEISEPYKGFPADKAGLVSGDLILAIDGKSAKGMDVTAVSNMLKGQNNTSLVLTIKKLKTRDTVQLNITRERIHLPAIPYYGIIDKDKGVGYIMLSSFTEDCSKEFKNAFQELKKTGEMKSLVIDLRGNTGGLMEEAINMLGFFVPKGTEVLSAKGRLKEFDRSYKTPSAPLDTEIPLAVLINSGSASASEIVSGTIQDLDRGILIGTRSFGKGLVQTVRPLGYNAKLKLTTAKYYIPSGRCIQSHIYSKKNEDGSVASVPDSLIKAFKTRNGRTVYDGSGVFPDEKVEMEPYSKIAYSIGARGLFYDYSLQYYLKHNKIDSPEKFTLSDADYENFIVFLADKEYDYETSSERLLKQLTETAKKEKYYDKASEELKVLSGVLKHDKTEDLQTFKPELKTLLENEIVNRYYYQSGRVRCSLRNDGQCARAVEIISNKTKYTNILSGV